MQAAVGNGTTQKRPDRLQALEYSVASHTSLRLPMCTQTTLSELRYAQGVLLVLYSIKDKQVALMQMTEAHKGQTDGII